MEQVTSLGIWGLNEFGHERGKGDGWTGEADAR